MMIKIIMKIFFFVIFLFSHLKIETKAPSYRAYCGYQLGMCYDLLHQPDNAKNVFSPVSGWVRKVILIFNLILFNLIFFFFFSFIHLFLQF